MAGSLIQGGASRMLVGWFAASGIGATGLTVTVDVYRYRSGSWSQVVTAAAATEIGIGAYGYLMSDTLIAAGDIFVGRFATGGTADQKNQPFAFDIESNWTGTKSGYLTGDIYARLGAPAGASVSADIAAIPASVQSLLTSQTITVRSPVLTRSSIEVVIGTSYRDTDGVPFEWDIGATPVLTGFTLYAKIAGVTISTCSITNAGTATQTLTIEPTAAETATMAAGLRDFIVYAINTTPNPDATVALVWGKADIIDAGL